MFAKVIATNFYGDSSQSTEGNGAIILTVPDAPLSLANNPSVTTKSKIGLTWAQGLENGGTAVIDFSIQFKQVGDTSFVDLASAVTQ